MVSNGKILNNIDPHTTFETCQKYWVTQSLDEQRKLHETLILVVVIFMDLFFWVRFWKVFIFLGTILEGIYFFGSQ